MTRLDNLSSLSLWTLSPIMTHVQCSLQFYIPWSGGHYVHHAHYKVSCACITWITVPSTSKIPGFKVQTVIQQKVNTDKRCNKNFPFKLLRVKCFITTLPCTYMALVISLVGSLCSS